MQLGTGLGHVAPHGFVAVQPLRLGSGPALEEMTEVELVRRARWQQHAVAQGEQERMAHHVGGERPRDRRHAGDLPSLRPVERRHDRIEHRVVRVGGRDRVVNLVVDARDDLHCEQPVDDHSAVACEHRVDPVGMLRRVEMFECRHHRMLLRRDGSVDDGRDATAAGVAYATHVGATIPTDGRTARPLARAMTERAGAPVTVGRMVAGERPAAIATLARAFHRDPLFDFIVPNLLSQARAALTFMGSIVADGVPFDEVWVARVVTTVVGVAVWLPPGAYPRGTRRSIVSVVRDLRSVPRLGPRLSAGMRLYAEIDRVHLRLAEPHWYLAGLGADPGWQRRGVGSALLEPVLARADRDGVGAYSGDPEGRERAVVPPARL